MFSKKRECSLLIPALVYCVAILTGCSGPAPAPTVAETKKEPEPAYFHVDPATAATVTGAVHFTGKKPARKVIDMSNDPACVSAHTGKVFDEPVVADAKGGLANAFVYIKGGLEGKKFEVPSRGRYAGSTRLRLRSARLWHSSRPTANDFQL